MNEHNEVINLVSDLVRIDSSNPWLVPGSAGEFEVGNFIADWLKALGMEVWLDDVEGDRKNVIAVWRGAGGGRSLCLNAHTDTVGYDLWKYQALQPRIEGDKLYGLGAADDKGHCAAIMLAAKAVVESKTRLRGDVWVGLTIDEEGTSSGTMDFVKRYQPDAALVLEPIGLGEITISHQGFGWIDVIVYGKAAHGCVPEIGIDAIAHMSEVVTRLQRLDREVFTPNSHPLNGKTVFHTGTIAGGTDYATYPAECVLGIEIGTQPGETIKNRVREIKEIFAEVREIYPNFKGEVRVKLDRNPFEAKGYEDLWKVVAAEVERVHGQPAKAVGENAWGDAALFQEAGIPTLMFGAAGANFHAPNEWVSISELTKLVEITAATIQQFCS
ncbi:MAG: M20/M25/M40 family metallo-hydrolase [Anaerolineaceae bacterium]|nr:M20/M25/M40 family metallo-hydrolase [Anaerolineaceae bacterium]